MTRTTVCTYSCLMQREYKHRRQYEGTWCIQEILEIWSFFGIPVDQSGSAARFIGNFRNLGNFLLTLFKGMMRTTVCMYACLMLREYKHRQQYQGTWCSQEILEILEIFSSLTPSTLKLTRHVSNLWGHKSTEELTCPGQSMWPHEGQVILEIE